MLKNTHGKPKKKSVVNKIVATFNLWFDGVSSKDRNLLGLIVNRRVITYGMLVFFCVGTYFLNGSLPTGFIPNEDQGMFYAVIQTPPGSTLERTNQISEKLQKIAETVDGVKSVSSLAGYEILTEGTGSNSGTCLINLKSWDERTKSCQEIINELEEKSKDI